MTLGFSRGQDGKDFFSRNEPATYFEWSKYSRRVHEELLGAERWRAELVKQCLPRGHAAGTILEAVAAAEYISEIRERILARGQDLFSKFTSAEWLWLIRNSDGLAVGGGIPHLSVGSEIQLYRLAENLVGFSVNSTATIGLNSSPDGYALWTARLMSLTASVDRLESLLRRISKGQSVRVLPRSLPTVVNDRALERRIQQYDRRHSSRVERWYPAEPAAVLNSDSALMVAFKFPGGWRDRDGWEGPLEKEIKTRLKGQFIARAWDFTRNGNLDRIFGSLLAISNPHAAGAILLLARAVFQMVKTGDLDAGEMIPKFGVLNVDNGTLHAALDDALGEAKDGPAWLSFKEGIPVTVGELEAILWSLAEPGKRSAYGALIHTLPDERTFIDLNALAWRLGEDLRLSKGASGPIVKLVSDSFELAVQAVVDATSYAPSATTADLRGRPLNLRGETVTDIDAMLVDGNTLLLISCKRIELGADYDAGIHARVRIAEQKVDAALTDWAEKTATLRENRRGDNYDLSSYDDIIGVVITPELVFTNNPVAERHADLPALRIPNLTAIDELADILDGRTSDATSFHSWLARRP